ncbi:MAG TPA: hypothetical protein VMT00_16710 [Thermoanaerobaculia bacterium]|nr:hypothetical protein [Thermoanaerobaculia bacterium]
MRWFNLAFVGWLILILALAIAAYLLGAPSIWIGVGVLALIGLGLIVSANRARSGP